MMNAEESGPAQRGKHDQSFQSSRMSGKPLSVHSKGGTKKIADSVTKMSDKEIKVKLDKFQKILEQFDLQILAGFSSDIIRCQQSAGLMKEFDTKQIDEIKRANVKAMEK